MGIDESEGRARRYRLVTWIFRLQREKGDEHSEQDDVRRKEI